MCKFHPESGISLGFAREIEGKQRKTMKKQGEIRELQGLNFLFPISANFLIRLLSCKANQTESHLFEMGPLSNTNMKMIARSKPMLSRFVVNFISYLKACVGNLLCFPIIFYRSSVHHVVYEYV